MISIQFSLEGFETLRARIESTVEISGLVLTARYTTKIQIIFKTPCHVTQYLELQDERMQTRLKGKIIKMDITHMEIVFVLTSKNPSTRNNPEPDTRKEVKIRVATPGTLHIARLYITERILALYRVLQ